MKARTGTCLRGRGRTDARAGGNVQLRLLLTLRAAITVGVEAT